MSDTATSTEPRVIVTLGKGGIGKSHLSVNLASVAHIKSIPVELYEGDPGNPTLSRYFPVDARRKLPSTESKDVEYWLENEPFSLSNNATVLLDLGANIESSLFVWMAERGLSEASRCRFIVPVSSIESAGAASRIHNNIGAAQMLLVFNEFGNGVRAAREDRRIKSMIDKGVPTATLPDFGRTAAEMSEKKLAPHEMAADLSDRFAAQGALTMLRKVEAMLEAHGEFRPW